MARSALIRLKIETDEAVRNVDKLKEGFEDAADAAEDTGRGAERLARSTGARGGAAVAVGGPPAAGRGVGGGDIVFLIRLIKDLLLGLTGGDRKLALRLEARDRTVAFARQVAAVNPNFLGEQATRQIYSSNVNVLSRQADAQEGAEKVLRTSDPLLIAAEAEAGVFRDPKQAGRLIRQGLGLSTEQVMTSIENRLGLGGTANESGD